MATASRSPSVANPGRYDAAVEAQLGKAYRRIRMLDLTAAALGLVAGTLAFGVGMALLDHWLDLDTGARTLALAGYLAAVAGYVGFFVVRPLWWKINPYYAARKVEETLPGSKNSVVNWLDLHEDEKLPGVIKAAVGQRAARDIEKADVEKAVSGKRAGWLGTVAGLLFVALVVLLFAFGGGKLLTHLGRAFFPFAGAGPARATTIDLLEPAGGNLSVVSTQDITFRVEVGGRAPDAVELLTRQAAGDPETAELFEADMSAPGQWAYRLRAAKLGNGFFYRVRAGDAVTPEYRVDVRASPVVVLDRFKVTYTRPAYTGPAVERVQRQDRDIKDYVGTQVVVEAPTNVDVQGGRLELLTGANQARAFKAELDPADPRVLRFRFKLETSGKYQIHFVSKAGDVYDDALPFPLEARRDKTPEVTLTLPGKDVELPANDKLDVEGEAKDDFGVRKLTLRMKLSDVGVLKDRPYRKESDIRLADGGFPHVLDYKDFVDLARLKDTQGRPVAMKAGMVLEYWLEAEDACDVGGGPNVGKSQVFKITLKDPRKDQQKLDQEKKQAAQDKQQHDQRQDDQIKQENKDRKEQAERDRKEEERQRREDEENKKNQKEQGQQDGQGDKKNPDNKEGEKGSKDGKEGGKDDQARKDEQKINDALKQKEQERREKERGDGKGDPDNQAKSEGKGDPDKEQKQDGKQGPENAGQGKGSPEKGGAGKEQKPDQGKGKDSGGKDGAQAGQGKQDDKQPTGDNKNQGQAKQDGDPKPGEGKGKDGKPEQAQAKPSGQKDGAPREAGGEKGQGGQEGAQGKQKDAGNAPQGQQGEKGPGQGKGEPQKESLSKPKEGGEKAQGGQQGGEAKAGPKEGAQAGGEKGEAQARADEKKAAGKGGHVRGDRADDPKNAKPEHVEDLARDLKSDDAATREGARRELEKVANQAKDGNARKGARQELDNERNGGAGGEARPQQAQGDKKGKEGQERRDEDGKQGRRKEGKGEQGTGKGGPPDPQKAEQKGTAKGSGEADPRNAAEQKEKLEQLATDLKNKKGGEKKLTERQMRELFDKARKDLDGKDPTRREAAREFLKEVEKQARKHDLEAIPEKDLQAAREQMEKQGEKARAGLGGLLKKFMKGAEGKDLGPAEDRSKSIKADGRHADEGGLQLDRFTPRFQKEVLDKAGVQGNAVKEVRDWKKRQAKEEEGVATADRKNPLGTTGAVKVNPDGSAKAVEGVDRGGAPAEYRDAYNKFTERLSGGSKKDR